MSVQIPVIAEKPLAVCGCRKFQVDALGDHLCTCSAHSGAKKAHDWAVDQLADLFRTTHKASDDAASDKLRKYRADYNFNPTRGVGFMPAIATTSGRLHGEIIRILFLQAHRETDRFFATS